MKNPTEQEQIDAIFARVARENNAAEAREPKPSKFAAGDLAAFLRKWSKGTPIVRMDSGATFWRQPRNNKATKLTYKEVEALVQFGFGTCKGDPRKAGAILTMKYPLR
jgi:hypothetical protein